MDAPDPIEIEASKAALRRAMAIRREEIDSLGASQAGTAMADVLSERPEWDDARRVALFASLPDEPDTRPIVRLAKAAGKQVYLPRCTGDRGLEMLAVDDWSDLRVGRFGILEPEEGGRGCSLADLDLILVPGVAFDFDGRRLGRGGGFYDRALSSLQGGASPRLVGVGFAFQLVDRVPAEEHDCGVGAILSERGWLESRAPR